MNSSSIQPVEILLVEDNPGDIRLTQESLKESKVFNNLHVVKDGESAMEFLNKKGQYKEVPRPNLILLDLNLPKMNGQEVLAIIKQNEELKTIPVVILTSSEADEDIVKSYNLHANCYITKPVDLEKFIDVVNAIDSFWFGIVQYPPK